MPSTNSDSKQQAHVCKLARARKRPVAYARVHARLNVWHPFWEQFYFVQSSLAYATAAVGTIDATASVHLRETHNARRHIHTPAYIPINKSIYESIPQPTLHILWVTAAVQHKL
jgi:hypothetical protein